MTVHVEEMVTEITVVEGELPLTQAQLEKVADFVIARLEHREREVARWREATALRPMSEPRPPVSG